MKFAVSNIGWDVHDDPDVLKMLREAGVTGIEVAPTKLFPDWQNVSAKAASSYRTRMKDEGFELPAMQALLFGKPELQVFDQSCRPALIEHCKLLAEIAHGFGSKVLVFGSPKNRKRGQLPNEAAFAQAVELFSTLADIFEHANCAIGLEHNPVEYGCDFVTNVADAQTLVQAVDQPGFKLHVDIAGVHMCGGDIAATLDSIEHHCHYHASEPMLEPIAGGEVDHGQGIDWLRSRDYADWVSIEMKQPKHAEELTKSVEKIGALLTP